MRTRRQYKGDDMAHYRRDGRLDLAGVLADRASRTQSPRGSPIYSRSLEMRGIRFAGALDGAFISPVWTQPAFEHEAAK